MFGFLNIYKPSGITSFDVIARLRKVLKIKQIGHAGTLDPLAEGVLPIAISKATRLLEFLNDDKAYICTLEFGRISNTYDTEGEIEIFSDKKVDKKTAEEALKVFEGEIEQTPPAFSAVHYQGKRLYELAREGNVPTDIQKRKVKIHEIKLLNFDSESQTAEIFVACSKGTYIRSIVHDLGQNLGCGAIMTKLIRTQSGDFGIKTSVELEKITTIEEAKNYLINPVEVLSCKSKELTDEEYAKILHGQALENNGIYSEDENLMLLKDNKIAAISKIQNGKICMKKVLV